MLSVQHGRRTGHRLCRRRPAVVDQRVRPSCFEHSQRQRPSVREWRHQKCLSSPAVDRGTAAVDAISRRHGQDHSGCAHIGVCRRGHERQLRPMLYDSKYEAMIRQQGRDAASVEVTVRASTASRVTCSCTTSWWRAEQATSWSRRQTGAYGMRWPTTTWSAKAGSRHGK